jgi:hypothetical protein
MGFIKALRTGPDPNPRLRRARRLFSFRLLQGLDLIWCAFLGRRSDQMPFQQVH